MFAVDWLDGGVQPDILIAAKGMCFDICFCQTKRTAYSIFLI
jgi:hypothetical protein